jgi:ABC-type cobalamin/Fe3+-siderophores transport system ATPase subunit
VDQGEIFGFLGPNGAGKSTTIHLMLNLLRPSSREVKLFGQNTGAGLVFFLGMGHWQPPYPPSNPNRAKASAWPWACLCLCIFLIRLLN